MEQFHHSQIPSSADLNDSIYSKIQKSKAILTAVMFATEFIREEMALDNQTIYHALWVVDDYLTDVEGLCRQLGANHPLNRSE